MNDANLQTSGSDNGMQMSGQQEVLNFRYRIRVQVISMSIVQQLVSTSGVHSFSI
jgi:hypothetical protein